jgi:hypothetical protein
MGSIKDTTPLSAGTKGETSLTVMHKGDQSVIKVDVAFLIDPSVPTSDNKVYRGNDRDDGCKGVITRPIENV